jgi:hypothetical protein
VDNNNADLLYCSSRGSLIVLCLISFCSCQDREHNFCLSFFWNYWWPLMFIAYPFLGRIW